MAWVVDTSVLLDIRLNDPAFGVPSARCLAQHQSDGLVLCPVTYIELAPDFRGDLTLQEDFLGRVGVRWLEAWQWRETRGRVDPWDAWTPAPERCSES